jgi:hypothetical protein
MDRNISVIANQFTATCFSASRRYLQGVQCESAELFSKVVKAEQDESCIL